MKSSTRDLTLKIIGFILFIIVLLIFVKYLTFLNNKNNNNSSQTVSTLENNNEIIHTQVNKNNNVIQIENERSKLMTELIEKIKNERQENFSETACVVDPTKNIYYLYLHVQLLEDTKFKPEPIWTNETFCLYKIKPVISLDYSITTGQESESDFYYPLGDILLFKDYANYLTNYSEAITKIQNSQMAESCKNQNTNVNNIDNQKVNSNKNNEGFTGKVTGAPAVAPRPDTYISNYDQPGLKGLQVLVKNGKKPLGFERDPVAVIKGANGENLYFWRPLAPEGYTFLGDMISIGASANMPMVDSCNLRSVPIECLDNVNLQDKALVASEDIKHPYKVFTVANGKYFKGLINNGLTNNITSYDMNEKCLNVERDETDTEVKLVVNMSSTDGSGNPPSKPLNEGDFNLLQEDYLIEITRKLVLMEDLKLNNVINNQNIDGQIFNEKNMRFRLESNFITINEFSLSIIFKKRAIAYGELKTAKISELIVQNPEKFLTYKFTSSGNEYTFVPTSVKEITMGMTPAEKESLMDLQKVIQELEKQVILEKEKKILSTSILDHLDLLVIDCKSLAQAVIKSLVTKEVLIKKCLDKINEINSLIRDYTVVELKEILQKLIDILEKLKTAVSDSNSQELNLNSKYMIDFSLKKELETLAKLAVRNSGAPADLDSFFKYHPEGITKSLSITELKKKDTDSK